MLFISPHCIDEGQEQYHCNGEGFYVPSTQVLIRFGSVLHGGGVRITERWYLDHMGAMAFWRTVIGVANLFLTVLVVLRVFEFL